MYDYQTTTGQRPKREYSVWEGKKEQESMVKIKNTGRSKCTLSVGVKELKSPFRKQKLPEGMGKKIKLCVWIVYLNSVMQEEQKNIWQTNAVENT